MPHNLYLHSALVQTRRFGKSVEEKREACWYNFIDSALALNLALLVNAGILILAASTFFQHGLEVKEIQQAHKMLSPLLGTTLASILFAVALLASGQSSTVTGTMAGQIVMEGFVNIRMQPWLRRLVTRLLAITPAVVTIMISGEQATYKLLILSQVVLSLQLPFAIIPLIHFTSDKAKMGAFANAVWVKVLAWLTAAVIVALNMRLAWQTLEPFGLWIWLAVAPVLLLLGYVVALPWLPRRERVAVEMPGAEIPAFEAPRYESILVPLDHSRLDRIALGHASAIARQHGAKLYLLHVEEGVTSQVYGELSDTAEVEEGSLYLTHIIKSLAEQGIVAEAKVVHRDSPRRAIIDAARLYSPGLIIMGAHGHVGIKDLIFGSTINAVRHEVTAPVLIVR